jgi:hypothetical protein
VVSALLAVPGPFRRGFRSERRLEHERLVGCDRLFRIASHRFGIVVVRRRGSGRGPPLKETPRTCPPKLAPIVTGWVHVSEIGGQNPEDVPWMRDLVVR